MTRQASTEAALATTEDCFLDGRVPLRQPVDGPRAGLDAVMLAAFAPVPGRAACCVLDVGSGAGAVAVLIAHHAPMARLTGIDIDGRLVTLANANAATNGFGERCRFVEADVCRPLQSLSSLGIAAETYDVAVSNPPFFEDATATPAATAIRRRAHFGSHDELVGWLRFMTAVTRQGGEVALVFPAEGLATLLGQLAGRFGGIRVFPLFPRPGLAARRILVSGVRGSRAPLRLLPGLVLHRADGGPTEEAEAILRHGQRIARDAG